MCLAKSSIHLEDEERYLEFEVLAEESLELIRFGGDLGVVIAEGAVPAARALGFANREHHLLVVFIEIRVKLAQAAVILALVLLVLVRAASSAPAEQPRPFRLARGRQPHLLFALAGVVPLHVGVSSLFFNLSSLLRPHTCRVQQVLAKKWSGEEMGRAKHPSRFLAARRGKRIS